VKNLSLDHESEQEGGERLCRTIGRGGIASAVKEAWVAPARTRNANWSFFLPRWNADPKSALPREGERMRGRIGAA
jgi:hypothetical protein